MRKILTILGVSVLSLTTAIAAATPSPRATNAKAMGYQTARMPNKDYVNPNQHCPGPDCPSGGTTLYPTPLPAPNPGGSISNNGCPGGICVNIANPCAGNNCPAPSPCTGNKCKPCEDKNNGCEGPGVEPDSAYSVDNCMNDLQACVGKALPSGLNDMFNSDLRNSIMNGMNLCASEVDKCIADVKRDDNKVYNAFTDVWNDFNSRVVQPAYYAFVLRRTGLTPNQAENTCMLVDKNAYGASFAAVSEGNKVTYEYGKDVSAYNMTNNQNNSITNWSDETDTAIADRPNSASISKNNPQGRDGKPGGNTASGLIDERRGYYARWDAVNADCLVRVAAYNKDQHIRNSWLFGALGDEKGAEAWKPAGGSFACNKDLFGFSLMNKTKTAAVVGIGGGAVVGGTIGAIAADKKLKESQLTLKQENCQEKAFVNLLSEAAASIGDNASITSTEECIAYIRNNAKQTTESAALEEAMKVLPQNLSKDCNDGSDFCTHYTAALTYIFSVWNGTDAVQMRNDAAAAKAGTNDLNKSKANNAIKAAHAAVTFANAERSQKESNLKAYMKEHNGMGKLAGAALGVGIGVGVGGVVTGITAFVERNNINCRIGDDMERISFGKTGKIDSLKDFYVKWNLSLPDTIQPTGMVTSCGDWKNACAMFKDMNQCTAAQINWKPTSASRTILVDNACLVSGSVCIENSTVTRSRGACIYAGGGTGGGNHGGGHGGSGEHDSDDRPSARGENLDWWNDFQ
ncbi:hypothetical protein FACS18945_2340 [Bacteroidia bacterium]|nr:hypothetical protein FACS18945_2340 [Bacteroidia bacterium]